MSYKKVFLKPGKEESLKRFHPWVFSGAIARVEGEPEEGEVVDVYTSKKEFIACGHFQIGSIAVRVLSFRQEPIDHAFWVRRLQVAKDLRCALGVLGNPQNNTYRLVHGEGDNLPGLIIDVYDHTAVMQAHSAGMHLDRMAVAEALEEVMGDVIQHIYYKSETTLPFKADLLATENGFLKGGSPENVAMENGLKFHVDWLKGQKTGFFVDQRENRALLERYAKGRNVLNMFCYTGGFSFYAMRGGANLVHSVDSSAKAIDLTKVGDYEVAGTVDDGSSSAAAKLTVHVVADPNGSSTPEPEPEPLVGWIEGKATRTTISPDSEATWSPAEGKLNDGVVVDDTWPTTDDQNVNDKVWGSWGKAKDGMYAQYDFGQSVTIDQSRAQFWANFAETDDSKGGLEVPDAWKIQ